jgi:Zn-dependent protease with chaperone function
VRRRLDVGLLALFPPLLLYLVFGAARVDAPVSLIGLLFGRPAEFALAATVVVVAGAALLFVRPIERRVANAFAPSRDPLPAERARLEPLLARLGARAGIDPRRLILRVQDVDVFNAAAGAAHLLFVTAAALRRPDDELEALLAHELGHHRGLHPVATAMVWWLSLPGEVLAAIYRLLRRAAVRVGGRVRVLGLLLMVLLVVWQLSVMWVYYIGMLLSRWAARVSEYVADRAAADWGYGTELIRLYASLDEPPPDGLAERALATHPPMERRIERLAAHSG